MKEGKSLLFTLGRKIAESQKIKNELRVVERENNNRRGITEYRPGQIEGFFNEADPLGNIVISGGSNSIRCRAIAAASACIAARDFPVILIHCGNTELEFQLRNMFCTSSKLMYINASNPIYDPLTYLGNEDISQLFFQSGSGAYSIPSGGKYYIEVLADYLRARGIDPYCQALFACPHQQMAQAIDAAVARGQLSSLSAQQMKSLLLQGQPYRSSIETYFNRLSQQGRFLLCDHTRIKQRISVAVAARRHMILAIDVASDMSETLINIITSELEHVISLGVPVGLVVDNISLSTNENLLRLLRSSNSNFWRILSAKDLYGMTGSNDMVFSDIINSSDRIIISSHIGMSCSKIAQIVGEYDKNIVLRSRSTSNQFSSYFSIFPSQDSSSGISISQTREYIIKPEEISRLLPNEVFIINRSMDEIAHCPVI